MQESSIQKKWTTWIKDKLLLSDLSRLLSEELSEGLLKKLDIEIDGRVYSLEEQIFLRYVDNRYATATDRSKDQLLANVRSLLEIYRFLLEYDLAPNRIKYPFIRALMDVISTDSGVYHLNWNSWYDRWPRGYRTCRESPWYIQWRIFRKPQQEVVGPIDWKYPFLAPIEFEYSWGDRDQKEATIFLPEQLHTRYAYPIFRLSRSGDWSLEEFSKGLCTNHKWCLERLSRCHPAFINKHKGKICRDIASDLGEDPDIAYHQFWWYYRKQPKLDKDPAFLEEVRSAILNCFTAEELTLFSETDGDGNEWNLFHQIGDRYNYGYPSFAAIEEIKSRIEEIVRDYKPLLKPETAEVIREIILDEVESVAFVSKASYLWNLEMQQRKEVKDLANVDPKVKEAIEVVVNFLPPTDNLRDRLLTRWRRAWFASDPGTFKQYLSHLKLYHPDHLRSGGEVNLQSFLQEVDMFFLYPQKGRKIKKWFGRMDTGRVMGGKLGIKRTVMSFYAYGERDPRVFLIIVLLIVILVVLIAVGSYRNLKT